MILQFLFIFVDTKCRIFVSKNNCPELSLNIDLRFLFIFVAISDGVFLFQKILFADKITKKSSNTQKYLHISQKSSTFAPDFSIVR